MIHSSSLSLIVVITYIRINHQPTLQAIQSIYRLVYSYILTTIGQFIINYPINCDYYNFFFNRDSFDRVPQKQQSTNKVEYYHIQDRRNRSGILSDLGLKERNALSSPSLLISKKIDDF